jgi:hypothetical protein
MRPNNLPSKLTVSAALFALALFVSFAAPAPASANDGDHEVRFRTALHGPAINGIRPEGRAEFEREDRNDRNDNDNDGHQKRFSTEVDKVNLGDNTILEVDVDGVKVGNIRIEGGSGDLEVHGKRAPKVHRGSKVSVTMNGQAILTGTL